MGPYLVAALVWGIGLPLGGTTGYAINPARESSSALRPRRAPGRGQRRLGLGLCDRARGRSVDRRIPSGAPSAHNRVVKARVERTEAAPLLSALRAPRSGTRRSPSSIFASALRTGLWRARGPRPLPARSSSGRGRSGNNQNPCRRDRRRGGSARTRELVSRFVDRPSTKVEHRTDAPLCQFREILAPRLSAAIYVLIHPTNLQFAGRSPQAGGQQQGATGFHEVSSPTHGGRKEAGRLAVVGPSTM